MLLSESIVKQHEVLALNLSVSKTCQLTIVGRYRPPSASSDALSSLMHSLGSLNYKELLLMGDFNLNWMHQVSDGFKAFCDTYNLFQLVDSPTRPNLTFPENSTLLDLALTNAPHKYSLASVFANDISDHCVVVVVRDTKLPKQKPRIVTKRCMKHFNKQGFLHDLAQFDWDKIMSILDNESAWKYFYDYFILIINKYAPLQKKKKSQMPG